MIIKAGEVLVIETGEYSDHCFIGPFKVLKDIDQVNVPKEYADAWKAGLVPHFYHEESHETPDGFAPWLIRAGYIEDVPNVHNWHVGSYGAFEPENQEEKAA